VTDDEGPTVVQPSQAGEPLLDIREVSVRFGGVSALSEVSVHVHAGTVTGLIGPNGAGKTTLFNVVSGLQRPDHGHVRIAGRDVTGLGPHRRARLGLARTFQRLELFSHLNSEDNVRVGLEAGRRAGWTPRSRRASRIGASSATALLDRVGVGGTAAHAANALPTGSARLVELARALSIGPRVLLLDEPCSGLDTVETAGLGRLLRELAAEDRAVLLVEHDMDLVLDICDRVFVLDFGEIIASGTPAEVREHPGVQAAYLGTLKVPGGEGQGGQG